jgi:outer membrane protein TolC
MKKICAFCLIFITFNVWGQEASQPALQEASPPVTRLGIDEAVNLALQNNLSLESVRLNTSTARRASRLSWNQFIPAVDIGGGLSRLNKEPFNIMSRMTDQIPMPGLDFSDLMATPLWRVTGSISASLSFNFAMFEEMNKLRLDYEKGLISYEKAKAQLERDVRKAYHNMMLLEENINLLRSSFENAQRQVQMAQDNYNAGLAPELTLLQAQVARENLRPLIEHAEDGLKLSMSQFAFFLGLPFDSFFELISPIEDIEFIFFVINELIKKAASDKPDIQELRHDLLSLNSIKKSTKYRLFTPTLSLAWNIDPTFPGAGFNKDIWKDPWFEDMDAWQQQSGMFRIMFGFRLNGLLPFTSENQNIKRLDDSIKNLHIGLAQMVRGTEIEVYNIVLALERTHTSMEVLQQTVSLAERSFRLTEQAYQAGLQDYFQVQSAEQSLHQARVQMLEQQFTYLNGLIDLEYSIGVPFGTLSKRSN